MTNPFAKITTSDNVETRVLKMLERKPRVIAEPTNNPFATQDTVDAAAKRIANDIATAERKLRDELRGNRESFADVLAQAFCDIRTEEALERSRQMAIKNHDNKYGMIGKRNMRNLLNAYLKQHGYTWSPTRIGSEEADLPGGYGAGVGEYSHTEWHLRSADGRYVTPREALDEIKATI